MSKLNLCLHCGGESVTRDVLATVKTPEATDTWQPLRHEVLVERVADTIASNGMRIVGEAHGLTRDGQRYFGMIQVANGHNPDDYGIVIGIRNSHDKSFPAALALGAGVFVCDNLSFSGEVKLARKHTTHIERDIPGLVQKSIAKLVDYRHSQDRRIACYKTHEMKDPEVSDALINAMDAGIIGPLQLPHVLKEWRHPSHDEFSPRTAWSLFNAFTEVVKGNATLALPRTQKLHGLIDSVCGILAS